MSTPELKPCPLCRGDVTFKQSHIADEGGWIEHVKPGWCSVRFSCLGSDENEALIKEWNTRHNPAESALNAAREALNHAFWVAEHCAENAPDIDTAQEWQARAGKFSASLAQIDKALSPQQSKTT